VLQGWRPTPLNAAGVAQARRLAERLTTFEPRVGRLVSSDLVRARQTAEPIAAALGIDAVFDPRWRERGLGEMEGRAVGERETWRAATGDVDPPGAESPADFQARALAAFRSLAETSGPADTPVAVVTHGGTIRSILRLFADGRLPLAGGAKTAAHAAPPPEVPLIANCSILHLVGQPTAPGGEPPGRLRLAPRVRERRRPPRPRCDHEQGQRLAPGRAARGRRVRRGRGARAAKATRRGRDAGELRVARTRAATGPRQRHASTRPAPLPATAGAPS
jgi:broad specificity phosphatase PhoE